ncbi:hypothetical protein TREMEDRAFT_45509 [Tremella mesenterica DSM 1558]|uniref:uncharacterized protein n=1 Tax=Tremella mesenterica (strain ATCC 24925 / CBS 8224 / DSM 1558 / NBRC 9311 / NRRL Y-6157 / RJB 2259-6 / UBC 559-6) TaxID=578456 RepID=UPI0003F4A1CE|nr:uncharacterized protein TREMEDRAFT_45509 [Tremella mesenterica DSM 1558]EIW67100.1 hypothetical protein TREMEDRAFT_45509 [Tremella mesenterica DSM 1558]
MENGYTGGSTIRNGHLEDGIPIGDITPTTEEVPVDIIPTKQGRKLCVRHRQMANQGINAKLQKSLDSLPTSERLAITQLWSTFSKARHPRRKLILEGILTMCCFSQLSHLSDSLNQIIRIDPFSLLPREVNLRILGYLDAISLGRAAQVAKSWKSLADDDLLWRRMCGQHIDRKCEKCGWGLPLLERKRLKIELSDRSPATAVGVGGHDDHAHDHGHGGVSRLMTRTEALGMSDSEGEMGLNGLEDSLKLDGKANGTHLTRQVRLTRPWKTVYCERLVVERNWRKGRCTAKTLKGHTDGVMCLQYHTALSDPSYPVLITGSYDRTARVWNLSTGEEVRVLRGHERAIRSLQFDQMFLFTGSMDGIVKVWNWRAGECIRTFNCHSDAVITLHYNGYLLATGSADSTIQIFNFRTSEKFSLRGHDDWVNSVVLWDGKTSPGDVDPTAMMQATIARHRSPGPEDTSEMKRGPDIDPGTMLFSASDDNTIILWDLDTRSKIRVFEGHRAQVQSLKVIMLDMSAEEIAIDSSIPQVVVHSSENGSEALKKNTTDVERTTQEGGKKATLVTGSLDGTVRLWDIETGEEKATLFGHIEGVWGVDVDALRIVSASHDRTVKVWDVSSGECVQTLVGHRGAVTSVQLSDDLIVSASDDGDVMVWCFAPQSTTVTDTPPATLTPVLE